jgi:hypothetical protein
MYLACPKCRAHWCWQCGDWGAIEGRPAPHHVHDCNKPPNGAWADAAGAAFSNNGR